MTGRAASRVRLATLNLGNFDVAPQPHTTALRKRLTRLDADILCLQEVNGQRLRPGVPRRLAALEALLRGTPYQDFAVAGTLSPDGDPADLHNLVIISRFPILRHRQYRQELIEAPHYRAVTAAPPGAAPAPIAWDRPLLHATVALDGRKLHLINLHLRAPLAAPVAGQKRDAETWRSVAGWAEGFFIAALKRTGQALEARLLLDRIFAAEPAALIAVAGDLNAELIETPLRVLAGAVSDTGNPALADRALVPAELLLPEKERYSLRYRGRGVMLDHILVSPALGRHLAGVEIAHAAQTEVPAEDAHGALLAEFVLPPAAQDD